MAEGDDAKSLFEVEVWILRKQLEDNLRSMIPATLGLLCIGLASHFAFLSTIAHLKEPAKYMVCMAFVRTILAEAGRRSCDAHLARNSRWVAYAMLGMRLLLHGVVILYDDDGHIFLKCASVLTPLSACTSPGSPTAFRVYLALHTVLVCAHYGQDLERHGAWIVVSVFVSIFCDECVRQLSVHHQMRLELEATQKRQEQVAEETTKGIFDQLCDASAVLSADGRFAAASSRLASLLGGAGNLQGRLFAALLHWKEAQWKADFQESSSGVQHRQVKLANVDGQPVPVHVFHATFRSRSGRTTTVLGISVVWSPPRTIDQDARSDGCSEVSGESATGEGAQRRSRIPRRLRTDPGRIDLAIGQEAASDSRSEVAGESAMGEGAPRRSRMPRRSRTDPARIDLALQRLWENMAQADPRTLETSEAAVAQARTPRRMASKKPINFDAD